MRPKARGDLHCGTFVAIAFFILLVIVVAATVVLACPKEAEGQSFTFYGNGWSVTLGRSSCGGWRPYCPPPPAFYGPPPCGGRGRGYAPPPRYIQRPPRDPYLYSQPMSLGYGGGLGAVYSESYRREAQRLEEQRQRQILSDVRRAARRAAERDFQFYGAPHRGW